MQRYFITLSIDGTAYHGWQIQPNGISVQEVLERSLSTLLRETITVTGAGRTDAGVHGRMMVAHFDTEMPFECEQLVYKVNRLLPRLSLSGKVYTHDTLRLHAPIIIMSIRVSNLSHDSIHVRFVILWTSIR